MMHELSICQALLIRVAEIAAVNGAAAVERVTIEIGALAGVDPALLTAAFAVMRAGSCAATAALRIESTGVRIECLACGTEAPAAPNRLICTQCGGYRTRVVAGEDLRLRDVELRLAGLPELAQLPPVPEPSGLLRRRARASGPGATA